MLKKLSLSAAVAAFMATGALAQTDAPKAPTTTPPAATDNAPATPATPATPPAATPKAPDASAATTTPSDSSVSFKSSMAQNEMLASQLTGMSVRNSGGEDLGDINDLVMDSSGKPSVAIIGVGGFLGLGEKDVGVPFEKLTFADAQDGSKVARLDVTKDALKNAPNFVYKDDTSTASIKPAAPAPSQ
jgi:sporulation protein YlmC with PRC-barrel domain